MGSKWRPVLKVWEQLQDKHNKMVQNSYTVVRVLFAVKMTLWISQTAKIKHTKICRDE